MATHKIAVLPGDGIGQEVIPEAIRVLQAVAKGMGEHFEFEHALCGGAAIDATGDPLPPATLALCQQVDDQPGEQFGPGERPGEGGPGAPSASPR